MIIRVQKISEIQVDEKNQVKNAVINWNNVIYATPVTDNVVQITFQCGGAINIIGSLKDLTNQLSKEHRIFNIKKENRNGK